MGQVRLTDEAEKSLVEKLTKAVTDAAQLNLIEQLTNHARTSAELSQAREALVRKDQQIHDLQARVAQLNGIITTMSQSAAPAFNPYNNNGPAPTGQIFPTFEQRLAATVPVPQQFAPVNANGHLDSVTPATS